MRFILKVDKEDYFKVAELKEITAVELLIIDKALRLLSQNEEVAERDRYVAKKLGAELMRKDAVQRPLTAIDGADIADTPQTESTGSPIGDYRDGVGVWQTDCPWRESE